MKCIRQGCKNNADISIQYGILPCKIHQQKESVRPKVRGRYDVATVTRLHRIQAQRDRHNKDLLQPYEKNKPNIEYFKAYPKDVEKYEVEKELKRM